MCSAPFSRLQTFWEFINSPYLPLGPETGTNPCQYFSDFGFPVREAFCPFFSSKSSHPFPPFDNLSLQPC